MFDRIVEAAQILFGSGDQVANHLLTSYVDGILSPPPEHIRTSQKLKELYNLSVNYLRKSRGQPSPSRKWGKLGAVPEACRGTIFPTDYFGRHLGSLTPASAVEIWQFEEPGWGETKPIAISAFLGVLDDTADHNTFTLVILPTQHGYDGVIMHQYVHETEYQGPDDLFNNQPGQALALIRGVSRCVTGAIKDNTINLFAIGGDYSDEKAFDFRRKTEAIIADFCHLSRS